MLNIFKKKEEAVSAPNNANEILASEKYYQEGIARLNDLIAPSAIKINPTYIRVGETLAQTIFVIAYPRFLHSNWFSPIINIDMPIDISMFVHPIETYDILKNLKKNATRIESQIHIEQEAGMVRDPALETAIQDIDSLRAATRHGKVFSL